MEKPIQDPQKSIYWISWNRNPYNDYLFNEINRYYRLRVFYIKEVFSSHPWLNKDPLFFEYSDLTDLKNIYKAFDDAAKPYQIRIIAGWNHPLMIMLILFMIMFRKPFAIWSDTPDTGMIRNRLKQTLRNTWLKYVFRHAKKIMVTGKIGVERMKEIGVPAEKVINFPFATDVNTFIPAPVKNANKNKIVFLSSGRLVNSHKGFDIAIRAFGMVKHRYPALKFSYIIAGAGPDEDAIRALIKEEKLEKEVVLKGWIQRDTLLEFYQAGDVFIHPSHFDPFPNVVLEAMAVGIPVIGSDAAGSVSDRVRDGINGYVFPEGDIETLSERIYDTMKDKAVLAQMQTEARKTALEWNVDYNINEIRSLVS